MEFCVLTSLLVLCKAAPPRARAMYCTCLSSSNCLTLIPGNSRGAATNKMWVLVILSLVRRNMIGYTIILCRIVSPLRAEPSNSVQQLIRGKPVDELENPCRAFVDISTQLKNGLDW